MTKSPLSTIVMISGLITISSTIKGAAMERTAILILIIAGLLAAPCAILAGEVSFKDHYDNTITLKEPAQRVVTIPKPAPAMFMAVDGDSQKLAGIHPSSMDAIN